MLLYRLMAKKLTNESLYLTKSELQTSTKKAWQDDLSGFFLFYTE